ncbi:MAG: hypothetical protein ABEK10_00455 [Candidatus Nanosalina sp.]
MRRTALVVVAAAFTGIISGFTVANIQQGAENYEKNFCTEVEEGLQQNMSEGFVNCFKPQNLDVKLNKGVRNRTSVRCVCRRKVNGKVEQINIAQPVQ